MDNLEKQLNNLPKAKLSFFSDIKIRFKLYRLIAKKESAYFNGSFTSKAFRPVPIVLLLLLIVFSLVPAYAYASPEVTRQHVLYPIKQAVEKIEIKLASSPDEKAEVYSKIATHRLEEAEYLSTKEEAYDDEVLRETIEEAIEYSVNAEQEIDADEINNQENNIVEKINKTKEKQVKNLEKVAQNIGLDVEDSILDSIAGAFDYFQSKDNSRNIADKKQPELKLDDSEEEIRDSEEVATSSPERGTTTPLNIKSSSSRGTTVQKNIRQKKESFSDQINAREQLEQIKNNINDLKLDLEDPIYPEEETANLLDRLSSRIEKVENSLDLDDTQGISGQLKSIEALTNNGKHFIKKRNTEEIKELEDESLDKRNELEEKQNNTKSIREEVKNRNR